MYTYTCFDGEYYYTVESEIPLQHPCDGSTKPGSGTSKTETGTDSIFGGIEGGLLPFGLGNILPKTGAEFIRKLLMLLALIVGILLFIKFIKRKK